MVSINVCIGSACHLKGSYDLISDLQEIISDNNCEDKVEVKAAFCLGQCSQAISVKFDDDDKIFQLEPKDAKDFFNNEVLKRI